MRGLALERPIGTTTLAAVATAAATVTGVLIARSPALAGAAMVTLALGIAVMRFGAAGAAIPAFAALPWLVIVEGLLPKAIGTTTAAIAVGALLYMVWPLAFRSPLLPIASAVFIAVVLAHAVYIADGEQAIQAAKYIVFPAIVLAVSTERARDVLPALKVPMLASCLAAMIFHLGVVAAGAGAISTYYEAGERLGFAAEGPHALALMAMIVAAAGLTVRHTGMQLAFFSLGAVPVALTGVRSALLGLAVILVIYLVQATNRARALLVLGIVGAVAVAAGGLDVISARFSAHPDEFSSFATAGSGRGEIWEIAFDAWGAAGPAAWVFGTGLRSTIEFELAALGSAIVGHSDIVEVLVQLGVVGFAAWIGLWAGVLRSGARALILLPILAFAVVNGSLEYVAPLTAGVFLAGVCMEPRRGAPT
ncbi:MAG TPA: O-antigen ligase family protein [Solirubrobacterales bacterium]|nr:O-antigen ligase family protein [Solirubrobacterales bacterium]